MNNDQVKVDNAMKFDYDAAEDKIIRDAMHNVLLVAVRGITVVCPFMPPIKVMGLIVHTLARVMCEIYVADTISVHKFRKMIRDIFDATTKGLPVITPVKAEDSKTETADVG